MKILIAGASGFVGSALTQHLATAGHDVCQLTRRPPRRGHHRGPSNNSRILFWDPLAEAFSFPPESTFDAVIHLGGANIAKGRWTVRRKAELRDSRINSTSRLATALAELARPPKVFACASAIGIYGSRGSEKLTENSAADDSFMGRLGSDWEAACAPARRAGIRVLNLRFGIVLSPAGGALAKMMPVFRLGLGGRIGVGDQHWSWISLTDLLRAIEYCLEHAELSGPINVVSPGPETNRTFARELGAAIRRPTLFPLPAFVARLALGEMADAALLASTRVIPERLIAAGFTFAHPDLRTALAALL